MTTTATIVVGEQERCWSRASEHNDSPVSEPSKRIACCTGHELPFPLSLQRPSLAATRTSSLDQPPKERAAVPAAPCTQQRISSATR
jgi:hypothetical protein